MKYDFSSLGQAVNGVKESSKKETFVKKDSKKNDKNEPSKLNRIDFGSFRTTFDAFSVGKKNKNEKEEKKKIINPSDDSAIDIEKALMEDFVTDYTANKTNVTELYNLLRNDFPAIAEIISNKYFNKNYVDIVPTMNAVIKLMTTKVFATSLLSTIKDGAFELEDIKYDFGKLISMVLRTSNSKMVDSTMAAYVEIMADHLYNIEMKQLQELGLSDEAATDVVIGIPKLMTQMTENDLKYSVGEFIGIILEHCDTTINTMDAESQKKLFYTIFPQIKYQTNKAVGKCFIADELDLGKDEKRAALYNEYVKMLYMILDEQDIQDIEYVLSFIYKTTKANDDANKAAILFNGKVAVEYDNIAKALKDFVENNKDSKEILFH